MGANRSPETLIATAARMKNPKTSTSVSAATYARMPPAATVPATRPSSAHLIPRRSIARRSRYAISSVSTRVQTSMGAGTNRGSSRMRIGAASRPIPKPTAPWRVDPTKVSTTTKTTSAIDKRQVY